MGRSGRHRQNHLSKTLRINVIAAAGLAVVALVVTAIAITGSGSSSAASSARAAPAPTDTRRAPDRVSRGASRTPLPIRSVPLRVVTKKHQRKPDRVLSRGSCEASYYGSGGHTASGEAFSPDDYTAAHKTLPLGSKVRVINRENDEAVVVRINDRGPFVPGRCLDLSTAAMRAVDGTASGVIPVRYEVLTHS